MSLNQIEYEQLIGQTKEEILEQLGFCFNNYISNVWMFRLEPNTAFFVKNICTYFLKIIRL